MDQSSLPGVEDGCLVIEDHEDLLDIAKALASNPLLAKSLNAIDIRSSFEPYVDLSVPEASPSPLSPSEETDEPVENTPESESALTPRTDNGEPVISEQPENNVGSALEYINTALSTVTDVVKVVAEHGNIQEFKWDFDWNKDCVQRPKAFWEALSDMAPNLKHLRLKFYTHELHDLGLSGEIAGFPTSFPELQFLDLSLEDGHGNDATVIDHMLHNSPKLESISFKLPPCPMPECLVQGLSYKYTFPELKQLHFGGYIDEVDSFVGFLERHPGVIIFSSTIDSDDSPSGIEKIFPNLRAVWLPSRFNMEGWEDLVVSGTGPSRPIVQLRVDIDDSDSCKNILGVKDTLRCLELELSILTMREVKGPSLLGPAIRELLAELPNLKELSIIFNSANISYSDENDNYITPPPINEKDLLSMLSLVPSDSSIEAIRMIDSASAKGERLSTPFLEDLPSTIIPRSLKYLRWQPGNFQNTYEIKKAEDGKMFAVDRDARSIRGPNPDPNIQPWIQESIFDHLNG